MGLQRLVIILLAFLLAAPAVGKEKEKENGGKEEKEKGNFLDRGKIIKSLEGVDIVLPPDYRLDSASNHQNHRDLSAPYGTTGEDVAKSYKFVAKEPFTSIVVLHILKKFELDHAPDFDKKNLIDRGVEIKSIGKKHSATRDNQGFLIEVVQNAQQTTWIKWISVFGNQKQTVVVTGICPEHLGTNCSREMKRIVDFARLR